MSNDKQQKPRKRPLIIDLSKPKQRALVGFFVIAGFVELILLGFGGLEAVEFTDSTTFCSACHTPMQGEITTHQASPHANVACTSCHVGPGTSYLVKSKLTGIPLVVATIFNTFDRPIKTPVHSLRPARETCEQCHWPQKFTQDRVLVKTHYAADAANTESSHTLVFKMGGGAATEGVHWHIASELWYIPLDAQRQLIDYVRVQGSDGSVREWVDPKGALDIKSPAAMDKLRFFDCVDCHNRATHIFYSPDELIDGAIARGDIDGSLRYVKREGLKALDPALPSLNDAYARADALSDFYRTNYPDVYAEKQPQIDNAVATLKTLARQSIFPEIKVTSETHADNLSHEGCFRCHGKLVLSGADPSKPLDNSCTLCHLELPASVAAALHGKGGEGPASPTAVPHEVQGRSACLMCHASGVAGVPQAPADHGGRANSSCLSCHKESTAAPTPAPTTAATPTPTPSPTPTATLTPTPTPSGPTPTPVPGATPTATPAPTPTPTPAPPTATPTATTAPTPASGGPPAIPHSLEGRAECLMCHATGIAGAKAVPADHAGRANNTCQLCHLPK